MTVRHDLKNAVGSLFKVAATRMELFGLELAEEKERMLGMLWLSMFGFVFFILALMSATVLVGLYFWGTEYRFVVLLGLVLFHTLAALACFFYVRSRLIRKQLPFSATVKALQDDARFMNREAPVVKKDRP
ncbi:MAG: phage holin family protein [Advenella sp.]|nr:phage holin family protein [Advenella sp.]